MSYIAVSACKRLRKKITWHIHEKIMVQTVSTRRAERIFNSTRAHRIFVSKYTKDCYPDNPHCTTEIVYNSLPSSFIKKVSIIPPNQRDRKTILMISSLNKAKGVDTFINIAQELPQYQFILILSSTKEQILNFFGNNIPSNVTLYPAQKDVHNYYMRSSLVLNLSKPSLWIETFGMTILEGMAYGLPAVVPNIGGVTELVKNEYNGICTDVTSIEAIKEAIIYILEDNQRYSEFASNSLDQFNRFNTLQDNLINDQNR